MLKILRYANKRLHLQPKKSELVLKKNKTKLPRVGDCSFVQCEFSELIWDLLIRFELICFALYRILGLRVRQFSRIS